MSLPKIEDIHLDDEFRAINRELTEDERTGLRDSIKADGVLDAVRVWLDADKWILVDGYNRYEVWHGEGGDPPEIKSVPSRLKSREEVMNWLIQWQMNRRNLNANERSYLIGKQFNSEKRNSLENLKNVGKSSKSTSVTSGKMREKRASKAGVSTKTVTNDAKFATCVDVIGQNLGKKAVDDIRAGVVSKKDTIAIAALPADQQGKAMARAKLGKPISDKPKSGMDRELLMRQMRTLMSQLVKILDARGKNGNHAKCNKALNEFLTAWEEWK